MLIIVNETQGRFCLCPGERGILISARVRRVMAKGQGLELEPRSVLCHPARKYAVNFPVRLGDLFETESRGIPSAEDSDPRTEVDPQRGR